MGTIRASMVAAFDGRRIIGPTGFGIEPWARARPYGDIIRKITLARWHRHPDYDRKLLAPDHVTDE